MMETIKEDDDMEMYEALMEENLTDDSSSRPWIATQSTVNSIYQSHTEKSIRKSCSELLELRDSVDNLRGSTPSNYLAFLRLSEEVIQVKQELIEMRKHVSAQEILVQDVINGVFRELEAWRKCGSEEIASDMDLELSELDEDTEDPKIAFLETIDVLLAEHKTEEALLVLDNEEKNSPELNDLGGDPTDEVPAYKTAFLKRKAMLVHQLVGICEQPSISVSELKNPLSGLIKLGRDSLAHQLLLKAYSSRLQKNIEAFIPLCSIYSKTYTATLSQLVFSSILMAAKESALLFGDAATYTNQIVQWSECEIESFVSVVKERSPPPEACSALGSASICIQASLSHCSFLESEGLKLSEFVMALLSPYFEEVLDLNFRRARRKVYESSKHDDLLHLFPRVGAPHSVFGPSNIVFTSSGKKFMSILKEILSQLTPMAILHHEGTVMNKIHQLFDTYVETLIKSIPEPSKDDKLHKECADFSSETDAQQLTLLGTAFTIADELLPMTVSKIFTMEIENNEEADGLSKSVSHDAISSAEYKDWRRHLQKSFDKLTDHFCRQYVLTFIYSREGKAKLDSRMYLEEKGRDRYWDSDALPSLAFQALFARLHRLASVAGDVLLGKEKLQKNLLSQLTEMVLMWLLDEREFWGVFQDDSIQLKPSGLQKLILDMHFLGEIAICGGYSSRNIHQLVSSIITRAIGAFSARGVDPQCSLREDEWFVNTAKTAINKLMSGINTSGSESSEQDENVVFHGEISDIDGTHSTSSSVESADSFTSANMDEV